MRKLKSRRHFTHLDSGRLSCSAIALVVFLAACRSTQAGPDAVTATPADSQTLAATHNPTKPAHLDHDIGPASPPHTPIIDQAGNPYRPDASYNRANTSATYKTCLDASGAATPAMLACMEGEFLRQRHRLRVALAAINVAPDSEFKDILADEQDAYMRDTDRCCRFDPATQGQAQMLDAQSCRINRYANRGDLLEALISP